MALVVAGYVAAALVLTWRLWADPASRIVAGNSHDADLFAWYLRYAATAVRHGQLPALVTSAMNAPRGVNMMWNTSVLLPGMLLAPVTLLFGPQVSLTVLMTAGFAGSAAAMFWLLRRWRVSLPAAALAGAVYGFSPALVHSALGHYNLQFAVLPPLIIGAGLRLAAGRPPADAAEQADGGRAAGRPVRAVADRAGAPPGPAFAPAVRQGAWLGALISAQLLISEEVALITALAGLLFVAVLGIAAPRAAARRARPAIAGIAVAAVVTIAVAGLALRAQFTGPLTQHGALFPPDHYVNDLTGFTEPSSLLVLHTAGTAANAAGYQGSMAEYLGYLGWPLIIVLAVIALTCWRRPVVAAAAVTLAALEVFWLGGHPLVSGIQHASVNLPWHWIEAFPLLATVLPDRLSLVADGMAAALLAVGIDAARARLAAARYRPALAMAGAVLACLPLVPRPLAADHVTPLPPGWQQTVSELRLPAGATVLIVPVPNNLLPVAMRWQADTGSPSSIVGGYFIGPGAGGQAYLDGDGTRPTGWYLDQLWAAGLRPADPSAGAAASAGLATATAAGPANVGPAPSLAQVHADFAFWRPTAVVAVTTARTVLGQYLTQLLGSPSIEHGDVIAWRR